MKRCFPRARRLARCGWLSLGAAALLTGCAGTRFVTELPTGLQSPTATPTPDAGRGLVVALTWPAAIDAKARDAVDQRGQAYQKAAFGAMADKIEPVDVTGGLPIASTYYAAEAYMALRRALPAAVVVLDPQWLTFDAEGNLVEKPMISSSLPVSMRLDVSAPQGGKFPFVNEQFTFSVRTPAVLGGANCGLFTASSAELDPASTWQGGGTCVATGAAFPRRPVWYLQRTQVRDTEAFGSVARPALPVGLDQTVLFPLVWYVNAGVMGGSVPDYVKRSRPATPAEADEVEPSPYIANHVRIAASVATALRADPLAPALLARYAKQFDPSLEGKLASGAPLSKADAHNAALLEKLLQSELKVRAQRDLQTARSILAGPYGNAVRKVRDASFSGFRTEMTVAWGTALSATGASMANGQITSPAQMLAAQQQSLNALAQQLDRTGKAFLATVAPDLQRLDDAWVEYAGQKVAVNAADQGDLQAALKRLYDKHRK